MIVALGQAQAYEESHEDLGNYWRLRLKLLSDAFELPQDWSLDAGFYMIVKAAADAARPGLFAGLLEQPLRGREAAVFERHMRQVRKAEEALNEKVLALAVDLFFARWPDLKSKAVDFEKLVQAGLPQTRPDSADFV